MQLDRVYSFDWALGVLSAATLVFMAILGLGCSQNPVHTEPALASCQNTDWFEIGRTDGVAGQPLSAIQSLKNRCPNSTKIDHELYSNGRNVGLLEYCTPAMALQIAKDGKTYQNVCPDYLESRFLPGYQLGQRIHKLESENNQVENRLKSLSQQLQRQPASDTASSNGSASKAPSTGIEHEMEQLRKRRSQIDSEISSLEKQLL